MKPQRCLALVALISSGGLVACSPDSGVTPTGDGRGGIVDAADGSSLDATGKEMSREGAPLRDAAAPPDAQPDLRPAPSGRPLPAGGPIPRRFLEGEAQLTGGGTSSCSNQETAGEGTRWCAFWRNGAAASTTELWVIDVTRAAAGEVPRCDGSSPGCRRLTTNLWTGNSINGPSHPFSHEFHGDTLLYYADASSGLGEFFRGAVYAWRAGWSSPRRIDSGKAIICAAHKQALVAFCLEDLAGDPMQPESFEVRGGPISDRDGIVLPSLGRVRPRRMDGAFAWQASFSPAGDLLVLSSADPDPAVESIRTVPINEIGRTAPREIIRQGASWEVSGDGRRIYFYREEVPEDEEAPKENALYVADFPSGANATKIDSKVAGYELLGPPGTDSGIAFLTQVDPVRGALRLLRDSRMPMTTKTVFSYSGILEDLHVSSDLRFTGWVDARFNVRIVRNSDLLSCDLNINAEHDAFEPTFLENAGLVFWVEGLGGEPERDGYFADPDGCQGKQRFGRNVTSTSAVGDRGLIFLDEFELYSDTGTLKYAPIAGGKQWPAEGPVRIADTVENWSTILIGQKPMFLIFKVKAGGSGGAGTYIFGPVPL